MIDPEEPISLQRARRFFGGAEESPGRRNLCERYERAGDDLVTFHHIADWLVSTGLDRKVVIAKFKLAARFGEFGRRARDGKIATLIDLDSFGSFAPGQYSLRPSCITVDAAPEAMRARKSTWSEWLSKQGWPVPAWLGAPSMDDVPAPQTTPIHYKDSNLVGADQSSFRHGEARDTNAPGKAHPGAPPKVRNSVLVWLAKLPSKDRELSAHQLAESYKADGGTGAKGLGAKDHQPLAKIGKNQVLTRI